MFKRWRNHKTYEWHLDKIERLHKLPMLKPEDQFVLIGALTSNTRTSFADGDIAEVAIWSIALSASDITSLSNGMSPLLVRPDKLVSYAPMTEATIRLHTLALKHLTALEKEEK